MANKSFIDVLSFHQIDFPAYETLYKDLHSNPGLSLQETYAAARVNKHRTELNSSLLSQQFSSQFSIHPNIGGHGLAAVLHNGPGATVLLRADMDALPVEENTGLDYASRKSEVDQVDGILKPVMHACGHDFHVTALLCAADVLARAQSAWSGTLVLIFQPNEERGAGARAMVDNGLYEKVPVPDVVLAQHVMPLRAGRVEVRSGTMMAASDTFKITLLGRGGHGSMPQKCVDPVVLAANIISRLQGIVSREVDPAESAVITVGSVQAGDRVNIIADQAVLKVSVRTQSEGARKRVLESIKRIVHAECQASGCMQAPITESLAQTPLIVNDAAVTREIKRSFNNFFGTEFNADRPTGNASEDVAILATSVGRPCCFWFFGGIDGEMWDKAERENRLDEDVPTDHSCFFALALQPTLRVGIEALCVGALTLLGNTSP